MTLSDIVNVQITTQTRAVSQAGFDTLLIVGESASFTNRLKHYSNIEEVRPDFALPTPPDGAEAPTAPEVLAATAAFSQEPGGVRVAIGRKARSETWTGALTAIQEENGDWYGLVITTRNPDAVLEVASWVEGNRANRKLFATASNDSAILLPLPSPLERPEDVAGTKDVSSIARRLADAHMSRTAVVYNSLRRQVGTGDSFPDAAWMGRQLTASPGASTWMFKTLDGISADSLSDTQSRIARAKNANTYESIGGVPITAEGKVASGEYIDIVKGVDWLHARLTERIFSRLVNLPKVPYTDAGVAVFETEIRAQLSDGVSAGLLANDPAPTVRTPLVRSIPFNDRAMRVLPEITFAATLAGAIHWVRVNGTVSV
jgi:hypothetical protein